MLVLTRHTDESIVIGNDIEITVLAIKGKTVKIGVTAPSDTGVHRSEIYVKLQRDKHQGGVRQK